MPHHDADRLGVDVPPVPPFVGTCYACDPPHPFVGDVEQHLADIGENDEGEAA
jgi:hypothetical protein